LIGEFDLGLQDVDAARGFIERQSLAYCSG
jgi:hypothetical protein